MHELAASPCPEGLEFPSRGGSPPHFQHTGGDPLVGIELEEGWWAKTRTVAEGAADEYVCCRGAGRRVEYQYRSVASVRANAPLGLR